MWQTFDKWISKEQAEQAAATAKAVQTALCSGFVRYEFNQYGWTAGPAYRWRIDLGAVTIDVDAPWDAAADHIVSAVQQQIDASPHMRYWTRGDTATNATGSSYWEDAQ